MPPQRLVFEGPTPESVILDAFSEYGPEVQLTEPERIRTGGMLGFFAQTAYRVRVLPPASAPHPATAPPVAASDELPETTSPSRAQSNTASRIAASRAAVAARRESPVQSGQSAPSALETLLDATPDVAVDLDGPPPQTFDEALARATGALGPEVQETGGDAQDAFDLLIARLRSDETPAEASVTEAFAATERRAEAKHLLSEPASVRASTTSEQLGLEVAALDLGVEATQSTTASTSSMLGSDLLAEELWRAPLPPPAPARHRASTSAVEPHSAQSDPARVVTSLRAVGFPTAQFAAAAGRLPIGFGLEDVFATVPAPRPLPRLNGTLIAIVGPRGRAEEQARRIAEELDLPFGEVAYARTTPVERPIGRHSRRSTSSDEGIAQEASTAGRSGLHRKLSPPDLYVETPEEAAALSPGWRRDRIAIVAVEVGSSLDATARARSMLRALRPSVTLMVASATQKSADVVCRANALGGADALLLEDLHATMTPAEVLAAEIPISYLGDDPASPDVWVRLVEGIMDRRSSSEVIR